MKKAKLKRKSNEQVSSVIETMKEENRQFAEIFIRSNLDRAENYEIQKRKLVLAEYKENNKILFKDLNLITYLSMREFFQNEQLKIKQKRTQQQGQGSQNSSTSFDHYFDNLRESEFDLPEY